MTLVPLYRKTDGANTSLYYVGEAICENCGEEAKHVGVYVSNWHKNNTWHKLFCLKCAPEAKNDVYRTQEQRPVRIVPTMPRGAVPVLIQYHGMSNRRDLDTFSAASKTLEGEEVFDRTRLSGRSEASLLGAKIGKDVDMIEQEKQFGDDADIDDIFNFHTSAAPALPGREDDDIKRLESDDE